jgi:hypothetical protein
MNHGTSGHMDDPAVHGMMVIGEDTVYLSHLPMFGPPHNYQVILEVTFTGEQGDPQAEYVRDRRESGERVYTLIPESFSLPTLASTDPEHPPLESFRAEVDRGHFEKGGEKILADVVVNVIEVIHFRKFDPEAEALPELEYFLFGKGQELYLAHLLTRPPDFDQILAVKQISQDFSDEELADTVRITFPGLDNSISDRIKAHQRAVAANNLAIVAGRELYFEESELRVDVDFGQTKAEKLAGF